MNTFLFLAEALRYPYPGQVVHLNAQLSNITGKSEQTLLSRFMQAYTALLLAEREELYTRTLDLDPLAAPYIGYQLWRENYKRGEFMAALNHEMNLLGVDKAGELPDHLIPVLRYLAATSEPLPELLEVLPLALKKMHKDLKKAEPKNPYLNLLTAIIQVCEAQPMSA